MIAEDEMVSQAAPKGVDVQLENGYVRIANSILEWLARADLTGRECRVLSVIFARTYGYRRTEARIALSDFGRATGITSSSATRLVQSLLRLRVIGRRAEDHGYVYWFNKDMASWDQGLFGSSDREK